MKIENCPFCGFPGEILKKPGQRDGKRFTTVCVRCSVCWARSREFLVSVLDYGTEDAEEQAVRLWNRRVDDAE